MRIDGPGSCAHERNPWGFIAITYAWSWLFWLPAVLSTAGWFKLPAFLPSALMFGGAFGPSVAAFVLVVRREGRTGAAALWKRGWDRRFGRRWLTVILLLPAGTSLAVLLGMGMIGEPVQWKYGLPPLMTAPVLLIIYLFNALPEEYGWRGYLLDALQARWNVLSASLVLGIIHGLWHLPLHFIAGTTQQAIPVWQFVLIVTIGAIPYTWFYNNTGGSVLAVALYHALMNLSAALVPFWITDPGGMWL